MNRKHVGTMSEREVYMRSVRSFRTDFMTAAMILLSVAFVGQRTSAQVTSRDIGPPAFEGSTQIEDGRCTVRAGGTDIWGNRDEFHFVYLELTGDFEAVARVVSLSAINGWSKAGLMVRQSVNPSSGFAFSAVTHENGSIMQWRNIMGSPVGPEGGGTPFPALPLYVKLVRKGPQFSAFRSVDGRTWEENQTQGQSDTVTIAMTDPVLVGLALTSHEPASPATAVFDNFTIDGRSAFGTGVGVSDEVANPESPFEVTVSVHAAENLREFAFDLAFDPSVMRAVRVREGPFLNRGGAEATSWDSPSIENEKGRIRNIRCFRAGDEGVDGEGVLATVTFEAKEPGEADLKIHNLRLRSSGGEASQAYVRQGTAEVYPNGSISGTVVDEATKKPVAGATVKVMKNNYALGISAHSADDGTFTIKGVPVGTFDVTTFKPNHAVWMVRDIQIRQGRNTPDVTVKVRSFQ